MDAAKPKLTTGAPAQLELALAEDIGKAQAGNPLRPVAVLLGNTLQRPYLQRRLAELSDSGGIANVRFLMPSDLALELGEPALAAAGKRPLPPLAERILLRSVAGRVGGYFGEVRTTPGLADALARLTRELRGAGYDRDSFAAALRGSCEVAEKETALTEIFGGFLERRAEFFGPDDAMLAADPARAQFGALFIFGLWQTLPALGGLIAKLAEAMPVSAYLPATGVDEVDGAHLALRQHLESAGFARTPLAPGPAAETTLEAAKAGLFGPPSGKARLDGSVRLLSGPDPTHELRAVARQCLAWASEGIGFHEMAIAYRHANPYRATIEAVMLEAGIPVYLHEGTPLAERPLGRRVLALLDLTESDFERRALIDFLSDGALPEATRELYGKPSVSRWDRFSRKAGVVHGIEQWRKRLTAYREELAASELEYEREDAERVAQLEAFVTKLSADLEQLPGEAAWSVHLAAFKELIATYVDAAKPVIDALENLSRFDALGETTSFGRFRETVRSTIENLREDEIEAARPVAFGLRGVNVVDVSSLRHVRFRAVAIVGVAERSFPPPPRPDPILLDDERERLNRQGPAPIPLRVRGPDPEPLQFALAVDAARERLLVTYPRKGTADSRPQLPSRFFRAVAESLVGHRVRAQAIDKLPGELYTHLYGNRIGAEDLEHALSADEYDRTLIETDPVLAREVLFRTEPRIARGHEAWRSRTSPELTEFDGVLTPQAAEVLAETFDPIRGVSPSLLEAYVGCPQKVFMAHVIRARADEEPEQLVSLPSWARGSLLHSVMERFLSEPPAGGEELLFGAGERERLHGIAEQVFAHYEDRGLTGFAASWAATRVELLEDLDRWLDFERDDPTFRELGEGAYEVSFGRRHGGESAGDAGLSRDEPLEVRVGENVVLEISGRIDRLNWDPDKTRFRVIDYKTGKSHRRPEHGALRGGSALQLPIYLLAAGRLLGIDPERGEAAYHYPTRLGAFAKSVFDGSHLAARQDDLERVLAAIVEGMSHGHFQIAPEKEWVCSWCDYNYVCPTGRTKLIERKQGSPAALAHAAIREVE